MHRSLLALALMTSTGVTSADGNLDPHFGIQGRFAINDSNFYVPDGVLVQADGRPVIWASVAAGADCRGIGGRRLASNATGVDTTFGTAGTAQACFKPLMPPTATYALTYNTAAINVPGGMVAVGSGQGASAHLQLAKFTVNGILDSSFGSSGLVCRGCNPESNTSDYAADIAYHPNADALVLVGHSYSNVAGPKTARVWVYSANGMPITQFQDPTFGDSNLNAVALQPDGKIVATGTARNAVSGNNDCLVERFILQGSLMALDTTFNGTGRLLVTFDQGGGNADSCHDVLIGQDGLIYVGGRAEVSGLLHSYATVARITSSGTLDNLFSGDGKLTTYFESSTHSNTVTAMSLHGDGKILLGGFGGTAADSGRGDEFGVIRIDALGVFDSTFSATTPGSGFATVMVGFEPITGFGSQDRLTGMVLQAGNILLYGTGATDMPILARLIGDRIFKNSF